MPAHKIMTPEKTRSAVKMRKEGSTMQEIADHFHVSAATIHSITSPFGPYRHQWYKGEWMARDKSSSPA